MYPLCPEWRSVLTAVPPQTLGTRPGVENPSDWAEEEFGRVAIYDERVKQRLYTLTRDLWAQPGVLIPQACQGSEAKTKAAYRLLDQKQVTMDQLLRSQK